MKIPETGLINIDRRKKGEKKHSSHYKSVQSLPVCMITIERFRRKNRILQMSVPVCLSL